MPKSLTVIIEKQLLPADEALHPENIAQGRDIRELQERQTLVAKALGNDGRMREG